MFQFSIWSCGMTLLSGSIVVLDLSEQVYTVTGYRNAQAGRFCWLDEQLHHAIHDK